MPTIALSYRRSDSAAITGRLFDSLTRHYGAGSVFEDIDSIPFGSDFRTHIQKTLAKADIVLVVIGRAWRGPRPDGTARIDDETDVVRIEVETALRRGIPVIPVLVDGAAMPVKAELPQSLWDFSFHNAAEIDVGRDFHPHVDRLIRSMDGLLKAKPEIGLTQANISKPRRILNIRWLIPVAALGGLGLGLGLWLLWMQPRPLAPPPAATPPKTASTAEPGPPSPARQVSPAPSAPAPTTPVTLPVSPSPAASKPQSPTTAFISEALGKAREAESRNQHAEAAEWYRKAADEGSIVAQLELGDMYRFGRGVTQDYAEAIRLFRLGADQGDAQGQAKLGNMYMLGLGVERDYPEAVRLFRLSADQGNPTGLNQLGWMYNNGLGVKQDYTEGMRLFRQAAERGNPSAENNLGWIYEHGLGIPADRDQALEWYRKAVAHGNPDAATSLRRLGAQ